MGERRTLEALKYRGVEGPLLVLDQLKLPEVHEYIAVETTEQGWTTIRNMNVRKHYITTEKKSVFSIRGHLLFLPSKGFLCKKRLHAFE